MESAPQAACQLLHWYVEVSGLAGWSHWDSFVIFLGGLGESFTGGLITSTRYILFTWSEITQRVLQVGVAGERLRVTTIFHC